MRRAYQALLRLYPGDYRALFAAEMVNTFQKAAEERRRQGGPILARFVLAALLGLITGAATEWISRFTRPAGVHPDSPRDEVIEAAQRIAVLIGLTVHAIANHDFPGARSCSFQEREARENLRRLREKRIDETAE